MDQVGFARAAERRQTYPLSSNCEMSLGAAITMTEKILDEKEFRAKHLELDGARLVGFWFENFTKGNDRETTHRELTLYCTFMKQDGLKRSTRRCTSVRFLCVVHRSSHDGWNLGEVLLHIGGDSVMAFRACLNANIWYLQRTA